MDREDEDVSANGLRMVSEAASDGAGDLVPSVLASRCNPSASVCLVRGVNGMDSRESERSIREILVEDRVKGFPLCARRARDFSNAATLVVLPRARYVFSFATSGAI